LKKYPKIVLLIAGMLAVISVVYAAPNQAQTLTTTTSSSQESSFYTATTTLGDTTITEILVNTNVQFPIQNAASQVRKIDFFAHTELLFVIFMIGALLPCVIVYLSRGSRVDDLRNH
jgi:uncharacterized membrane protein